jgi:hypothetical protein
VEDKEAIEILLKLLENDSLSQEQRVAVRSAIGILSWTKLAEGRIKSIAQAQKAKLDKRTKWR